VGALRDHGIDARYARRACHRNNRSKLLRREILPIAFRCWSRCSRPSGIASRGEVILSFVALRVGRHARPGQHESAEVDRSSTSAVDQALPNRLHHPDVDRPQPARDACFLRAFIRWQTIINQPRSPLGSVKVASGAPTCCAGVSLARQPAESPRADLRIRRRKIMLAEPCSAVCRERDHHFGPHRSSRRAISWTWGDRASRPVLPPHCTDPAIL